MTETIIKAAAPGQRTPSHAAYHVRHRDGRKALWTRVGSAWAHADGKGFNVQLDALPRDGRIALRAAGEQAETGDAPPRSR